MQYLTVLYMYIAIDRWRARTIIRGLVREDSHSRGSDMVAEEPIEAKMCGGAIGLVMMALSALAFSIMSMLVHLLTTGPFTQSLVSSWNIERMVIPRDVNVWSSVSVCLWPEDQPICIMNLTGALGAFCQASHLSLRWLIRLAVYYGVVHDTCLCREARSIGSDILCVPTRILSLPPLCFTQPGA